MLGKYLDLAAPFVDPVEIEGKIIRLAELDRPSDFDSFNASAEFVAAEFAEAGLDSEILRFPADGETKYHGWTAPIGFRTTKAVCEMIDPNGGTVVLGDRAVEPNTAVVGCGHTGPEGVAAEVVMIDEDTDWNALDAAGKILYANFKDCAGLRPFAIKHGAAAVVSSFIPGREINRDFVKWTNAWDSQSDGWMPTAECAAQNLPAISLSPAMGEKLEAALASGPVESRIIVEGEYFESELPAVNALLAGREPVEVMLTGHIFEQGLVDNASGAATSMAVAKVVSKALDDQPKRGLRGYHGQECYGALALAQFRPDIVERAFAHLNIDMIDRVEKPLMLHPGLMVSRNMSHSLLTAFLDAAAERLGHRQTVIEDEFDINCTVLAEPALGGVSTNLLAQANPEWHSSRDRAGVQRLDPETIRYSTLVVSAWALFLMNAGTEEAEWLVEYIRRQAVEEVREKDPSDAPLYLELKRRELTGAAELADDDLSGLVEAAIDELSGLLDMSMVIEPEGSGEEIAEAEALFPKTIVGGPMTNDWFTPEQLKSVGGPKWSNLQLTLKSWADGERSINEIARRTSFELGSMVKLPYALNFFKVYRDAGIVEMG